ncbi:MAG: universal stress protein [Actinomycetota bacterium]|nr:universal stress protein [Actinomycetota bacterium]
MNDKLLFAVDFSPYTEKLLGCAGELASVGMRDVVMLHAVNTKEHAEYGDHLDPAFEKITEEATKVLDDLSRQLKKQGFMVEELIEKGNPAEVIVETAREKDVGLIFMGGHGKGFLHRHILGSVTEKVLKLADRSVMIQHCRVDKGKEGYSCENVCTSLFGNILVANDFSDYADKVKPLLIELAKKLCTPMTLLHVQEGKVDGGWQLVDEAEKEKIKDKMDELQELSYTLGEHCESVRTDIVNGSPSSAILDYAREIGATLIILGAFGHQGIIDSMLGSVTEKVLRKSEIPVLVLKA